MGDQTKPRATNTLFEDGQDPRAYFVTRIRARAKEEGLELTELERTYLDLTEHGDDDGADAMLKTVKGKKFKEFDSRISGLAWRAYLQDLAALPEAKERYREATMALANVDESPNLGMFVNCIALERSPEELNKTSPFFWIFTLVFTLFVLLAWLFTHIVNQFQFGS